ncbi:YpjP family protein [Bacillus sp. BRMEA1]|uniref:YpjP family protein n=1 Tax=Neobacillus endophyticus TaxID=2738405 RepID=UPI0015676185|nr:YpjP family protein [Neobacillus endophyticus]NRD80495.1 YpjP family protein [Neobacillus endophyticus]
MNKWVRKTLFIFVSILTFGLITPAQLMNTVNADSPNDRDVLEAPSPETGFPLNGYIEEPDFNKDLFLQDILNQAERQSYQKFGTKIKPVIENEFREMIWPNIEKAIEQTAAQFPEEDLKSLSITEQPGAGYSEKIFNIKNNVTGKDILKFHVRRDHPPQAGYWFNFHYHTYHDQFQGHYELGAIYWDSNVPPKWMS